MAKSVLTTQLLLCVLRASVVHFLFFLARINNRAASDGSLQKNRSHIVAGCTDSAVSAGTRPTTASPSLTRTSPTTSWALSGGCTSPDNASCSVKLRRSPRRAQYAQALAGDHLYEARLAAFDRDVVRHDVALLHSR